MKVTILCVGKIKETYFSKGIEECCKKIRRKISCEIIELADEKTPDKANQKEEDLIREKEGMRILSRIKEHDYVIALCIEGQMMSSDELKKKVAIIKNQGVEDFVFVIGGSLGLDKKVVKRANCCLSFSRLTFPHQMMRYILIQQLTDIF